LTWDYFPHNVWLFVGKNPKLASARVLAITKEKTAMTKTKIQVRNPIFSLITAGCVVGALAAVSQNASAQEAVPVRPVEIVTLNDSPARTGSRANTRNLSQEEREARRANRPEGGATGGQTGGQTGEQPGDQAGGEQGGQQGGRGDRANGRNNRANRPKGPVGRYVRNEARDLPAWQRRLAREHFQQMTPKERRQAVRQNLRHDRWQGMSPRHRRIAQERLRHMTPNQRQRWYRKAARHENVERRNNRRHYVSPGQRRHMARNKPNNSHRASPRNQRNHRGHGITTHRTHRNAVSARQSNRKFAPSKRQLAKRNVRLKRQNVRLKKQNRRLRRTK
jgi:hypothetical protein